MRVLLLAQKLPRPLTDGYNLRIEHYARRLALEHELHLVALDEGELPPESEVLFASVRRLPVRRPPRPRNALQRLAWALSVDQVHDRDPAVAEGVRATVARLRPDVVWISGWVMLGYADAVGDVPILGDVVDEGAEEARVQLEQARGPGAKLLAWKRWTMLRAFERRFFRKARLVCLVSEADQVFVQRDVPGLATCVVNNGVDADFFRPLGTPPNHPSLVFEGTMAHVPNAEGIVHFQRTAWPRIRAAFPSVSLTICGRDPLPEVLGLAGEGVEVTGFVDDVRPFVDRASLFVSPLIGGAGIKNKVLQAWAMGKAVVATPLSSGGLAVTPDNLRLAEPGEAFARACIELLGDESLRARMGACARATVLAHYSWDAKARDLAACLALAAGRS